VSDGDGDAVMMLKMMLLLLRKVSKKGKKENCIGAQDISIFDCIRPSVHPSIFVNVGKFEDW
jgi:hypothetical protein